jgi:hypothetical protein
VVSSRFGASGKGLSAEGVTIRLLIPTGVNVINATGAGYKDVQMDGGAKPMSPNGKLLQSDRRNDKPKG